MDVNMVEVEDQAVMEVIVVVVEVVVLVVDAVV